MRYVFVRFERRLQYGVQPGVGLLKGEEAESHESFFRLYIGEDDPPITILDWVEVPTEWENEVTKNHTLLNDILEALIGLDAFNKGVFSKERLVSDLLATVFELGYYTAANKKGD